MGTERTQGDGSQGWGFGNMGSGDTVRRRTWWLGGSLLASVSPSLPTWKLSNCTVHGPTGAQTAERSSSERTRVRAAGPTCGWWGRSFPRSAVGAGGRCLSVSVSPTPFSVSLRPKEMKLINKQRRVCLAKGWAEGSPSGCPCATLWGPQVAAAQVTKGRSPRRPGKLPLSMNTCPRPAKC